MSMSKANNRVSYLSGEATDVLVSANPKAGARSRRAVVEQVVEELTGLGYRAEVFTDIDRLSETATERLANGSLRAVVAAGGDGTVSLVVNRTPPDVPVMAIPFGTESLLARYLKVTANPGGICRVIQRGAVVRLDAGQANGHIFLLMVGCGFDAEVVRRLHQQRGGHIRHLSYLKPIFQSIRSYEYPELRIYSDASNDGEPQIRARWAFVVNVPRYAMGLGIAPDADGADGWLDVCTFRQGSLWKGLAYLAGVVMGRHQSWDDCVTLRAQRVRIESDSPVPYQLDGDPGGYLPLDIEVLPRRVTLLVPEEWDGGTK
jgi:diacylglycerol kinase family enzyme